MTDVSKTLESVESGVKNLDDRIQGVEKSLKDFEKFKANLIAPGTIMTPNRGEESVEKKAMRRFGCSHVKQLLDVNTGDPMYKHVPDELKMTVLELKRDVDISRMMQQRLFGEPLDQFADVGTGRGKEEICITRVKGILDGNRYGKEVLAPKLKAAFDLTADAEWVPTAVSSRYFEEFELDRLVERQFRSENMPTSPYDLPVQDTVTKARIQAENATIADVKFDTSKITMTATKLAEFAILSTEIDEDSAPNILSAARDNVMQSQERAVEDSILNGDDTATMDSDIGGATDNRRAWKGLRKLAVDNSGNGSTVDFLNAAITLALWRDMRTAMGKYGIKPMDLRLFVSSKTYNQLLAISEVTTVEKYGNAATIIKGELGRIDGVPIIISEHQRDDLNATGVHDGVTTDRSVIMLANRTRFFKGQRRAIRAKLTMHPVPPNDQWLMASWQRADWKGHVQDATEVSTVLGFNIA